MIPIFLPEVQNGNVDYVLSQFYSKYNIKAYAIPHHSRRIDHVFNQQDNAIVQGEIADPPVFHPDSKYQLIHWQKENGKRDFGNAMSSFTRKGYSVLMLPSGTVLTQAQLDDLANWCKNAPVYVPPNPPTTKDTPPPAWLKTA